MIISGSMLDYSKVVLQKVSFDTSLFTRELEKSSSWLLPNELEELKIWLEQFIVDKPELIHLMFLLKTDLKEGKQYLTGSLKSSQ